MPLSSINKHRPKFLGVAFLAVVSNQALKVERGAGVKFRLQALSAAIRTPITTPGTNSYTTHPPRHPPKQVHCLQTATSRRHVSPLMTKLQTQKTVRGRSRTRHLHRNGWEEQPAGPLMGPDQSMGPGGLATPEAGGCLRAPPQQYDRC